jgi:hypothetical protein
MYHLFAKYEENMTIEFQGNIIKTECELDMVYINGHAFFYDNLTIEQTKRTKNWGVFFFTIISTYLSLTNLLLYNESIISLHKWSFLITSIYFGIFALTELICLIPSVGIYKALITDVNDYAMGSIALILFGLLTYKSIKK